MAWACNLHVTSGGNRFIVDLAELYRAALVDLGVAAAIVVDQVPQGRPGTVDVIVGPHEHFATGLALSDAQKLAVAERSVLLTTEQPGSRWWDEQRPWAQVARLVLDVSPIGVAAHRAEGVEAVHAPVGYHASLDAWEGADVPRDIDVAFLGGATPRRLDLMGDLGPVLSHRRSRLLFHDPLVPVTQAGPYFVSGRDKAELLSRSRILLNVHRGEDRYFEWARAIEALSNGALLVTEPSVGHQPLVPMTHFVAADVALMPAHLTALLADEQLRAKVAAEGYDFVRTELRMVDLLAPTVVPALEDAASSRAPGAAVLPEALGQATEVAAPAMARHVAGPPLMAHPEGNDHRALATLKRLLIGQIELDRRLDRMEVEARGGHADDVERRSTPGWDRGEVPDVTVVVPLHDYESTVIPAICSAVASRHVTVEVVVVDDRSTDGSRAVVEAFMDEHPDVPILALFRAVNAGPSVARNLGITEARSDRCFLLDADNLVYPDALWKLRDALDATGAAFAYSILEVFEHGRGLVSARPWQVASLVNGPYIDAMSLLHRDAWRAVGGFREPDDVLYGLEDYAFWLALADQGLEGAWVPEPLGRYRRHGGSRTSITGLDVISPLNHLRCEYPDLPWPG